MLDFVPLFVSTLALMTLLVALWSFRWPKVDGKIDVSIFDREWDRDVFGNQITFEMRGKHHLAYTYAVGDRVFQSSRIAPLVKFEWEISGSPDLSSARDDSRWYREGGTVAVYFCPLWPRWSCLEPGGFMVAALLSVIAGISYFAL